MEVILNINNLNYGESLLDISMYIDKNRITSIAGANNSGKTSLIKIIGRVFDTTSNIIFDGKSIYDYKLTDYNIWLKYKYKEKYMGVRVTTGYIYKCNKCGHKLY